MKRKIALSVAVVFFASACATIKTSYTMKDNRLVTAEYEKDGLTYHRDGESFKAGSHNKGLVEAVSPNPEAKKFAEDGVHNSKKASAFAWSALVPLLASVVLVNIGARKNNNAMIGSGLGLLGVGLTFAFVSLKPTVKAASDFQDAINKYNDDVLQKSAPQMLVPSSSLKEDQK